MHLFKSLIIQRARNSLNYCPLSAFVCLPNHLVYHRQRVREQLTISIHSHIGNKPLLTLSNLVQCIFDLFPWIFEFSLGLVRISHKFTTTLGGFPRGMNFRFSFQLFQNIRFPAYCRYSFPFWNGSKLFLFYCCYFFNVKHQNIHSK